MKSFALLLFCMLRIANLNGAVISDNVKATFMGYTYEKPAISFDLPQEWVKMKPTHVLDNKVEQPTAGDIGIGQETLMNMGTNEALYIFTKQEGKIEENFEPVIVDEPDTDIIAIDLRGNFDEVEFQYPSEHFNRTEFETKFEHQEVASQHEPHRRGPVKRIKFKGALENFNFATYTASLKGCENTVEHTTESTALTHTEWSSKSTQRPPNRRKAPYTEVLTNEAYFHQ